ncbi:hypothetical protein [Thalassorhabdomicrobium marinisediminis]|uniref:hypothetical protein n=1 Tax=Thalassorhabdomicrobium marinisediminis TaxID=2170577 RepID=UPI0024908EA4|nr:hypothetical protein [Thalassorhabdomicrobium marinisediminis]
MRMLIVLSLILPATMATAQEWCNSATLNPTERTICADPILGELDADLTRAYRASDRDRAAQSRWLRARNACGTAIGCIEERYAERIAALRGARPVRSDLRPWCDGARLNPTEQTICRTETLADLDAALQAIYGAAQARDADGAQLRWLRDDRDACGTDTFCIGDAYLRRIMALGRQLRLDGK